MASTPDSADRPNRDAFAKQVLDGIRRAGETRNIVYDKEHFRLFAADEPGNIFNLVNIFDEYCAASAEGREKVLRIARRTWFSARRELPEDFSDVRPDLLPAVRARSFFELLGLQSEVEGHGPGGWPYEVLGEHLAVGLVYDLPEAMQVVRQVDLDRWGVTLYEALEAARENLLQWDHPFIGPDQGEGLYMSMTSDGYAASRMALMPLVRKFQVKGSPVAMVPNRETLLVAGDEDPKALAAMAALAKDALEQPRCVSGLAFRLEGEDWEPWLPPLGHAQHQVLKRLAVQSLGQDYAEQKRLLDRLHEKTGEDVFVASFNAFQGEDTGEVSSYCIWPEGVHAVLPKADVVALMRDPQSRPVMAPWERVLQAAGDLVQPLDIYPFRFRVEEFPDEQGLSALDNLL
jgi:hypothetical protein